MQNRNLSYRKKPVEIEAYQLTPPTSVSEWPNWLQEALDLPDGKPGSIYYSKDEVVAGSKTESIYIATLEGPLKVTWNDYIIRGVKGEIYPCKPDIFELTYEAATSAASLTFQEMQDATAKRNAEWCGDTDPPLSYHATELGGEVGELLNIVKKLERERYAMRGSRATMQDAEAELADVVACVFKLGHVMGIDVGQATKHKFNFVSQKQNLQTRL